jgi:hypothetical protein
MSDFTNNLDNIYHADYLGHSRKGKKMDKHKKANGVKKIIQFKTKNNLGPETWLSSWDIYKATVNKKRSHSLAKSVRTKGYDYKFFTQSNEIPHNNTTQDQNIGNFHWDLDWNDNWDCNDDWSDNYSDYSDCRSYSEYWDDDWERWDFHDAHSVCSHRTNRTFRSMK